MGTGNEQNYKYWGGVSARPEGHLRPPIEKNKDKCGSYQCSNLKSRNYVVIFITML